MWMTDAAHTQRLFTAMLTLFKALEGRLNDKRTFSGALQGGGLHACQATNLDPSWAPVIEGETARLIAQAGGLHAFTLFSPAFPLMIAAVDRQSLAVQHALVKRALLMCCGEDATVPHPRFVAALARATPHVSPASRPPAGPPPAKGSSQGPGRS
jgi:hypothetical protein